MPKKKKKSNFGAGFEFWFVLFLESKRLFVFVDWCLVVQVSEDVNIRVAEQYCEAD